MNAIIWLGLLAVLLVIEALTVGLTTIWFAGGALIALISVFFGAPIWLQIGLFLVISLVLLIFTRPAAVRFMNRQMEPTNVAALIGKTAVVKEKIDNVQETGVVHVQGLDWMARTKEDGIIIEEDAVVRVLEVQGVKLIVERNQ
ncbi:MAG: NfeD family protein [Blautia sp.]|jgi:membrane protein implicated in regulation of membrane protease activity